MTEYVIYCDESDADGKYYANFYGGLLIRSDHIEEVKTALIEKKKELNLERELKWQRVSSNYLEKYQDFTNLLFSFVSKDFIKIRVMFTQHIHVTGRYDDYQRDNKYFLLYYQFIKHAFGLRYVESFEGRRRIRLYLDKMPDTREKVASFKDHIVNLNKNPPITRTGLYFDKEQIAEIDSKEHVLAQSLDIVLGAMQFRLNDKHREKPAGSRYRGKRTIAKEKLYKHINSHIRDIYPGFNIGINTGDRSNIQNRWNDPYRHWLFRPHGSEVDTTKGKNERKKK